MIEEEKITIPSRQDSLANKQEKRWQHFSALRQKLMIPSGWKNSTAEKIILVILFSVNFLLLKPFFGHEDQVNYFSAPVVPLLASTTERLIPFPYAIRLWLMVFLVFFPLTYYWLVREISGRKLTGLLATLIATLPLGIFLSARVKAALFNSDGAHIASLTLVPLACLFLLRFLKKGAFGWGVVAALAMAVVTLTSPVGSLILATFMTIITFSEMLLGQGRFKAIRFVLVMLLAVGFSAFWYHPNFLLMVLRSPQGLVIIKTLSNLVPISFFLFPILGVFGFLLFENRPQLQPIFIAFFLTVAFGLFSLGMGVAHDSPSRFIPAFGISLSFWLGILLVFLIDFLRFSPRVKAFRRLEIWRQQLALGIAVVVFISISLLISSNRQNLWQLKETQILGISSEQKVGVWQVRGKTSLWENILGYTITGLTTIGTFVIKSRLGM